MNRLSDIGAAEAGISIPVKQAVRFAAALASKPAVAAQTAVSIPGQHGELLYA